MKNFPNSQRHGALFKNLKAPAQKATTSLSEPETQKTRYRMLPYR